MTMRKFVHSWDIFDSPPGQYAEPGDIIRGSNGVLFFAAKSPAWLSKTSYTWTPVSCGRSQPIEWLVPWT